MTHPNKLNLKTKGDAVMKRKLALLMIMVLMFSMSMGSFATESTFEYGNAELSYKVYGSLESATKAIFMVTGYGDADEALGELPAKFVTADTVVVTYDRRGLGDSTLGDQPLTCQRQARALHKLVLEIGVEENYFFAHSIGGIIVQSYEEFYPELFDGALMVETSHPYQNDAFIPMFEVVAPDFVAMYTGQFTAEGDWDEIRSSFKRAQEYDGFGSNPVSILYAPVSLGMEPFDGMWVAMQNSKIGLSTNSKIGTPNDLGNNPHYFYQLESNHDLLVDEMNWIKQ